VTDWMTNTTAYCDAEFSLAVKRIRVQVIGDCLFNEETEIVLSHAQNWILFSNPFLILFFVELNVGWWAEQKTREPGGRVTRSLGWKMAQRLKVA